MQIGTSQKAGTPHGIQYNVKCLVIEILILLPCLVEEVCWFNGVTLVTATRFRAS